MAHVEAPAARARDHVAPAWSGRLIGLFRICLSLIWIENAGWKKPPEFEALRAYTQLAVDHPVSSAFTWVVSNVVIPNIALFGWMTLLVEASLGAFLLIGLVTRLVAVIALGQTVAISLSVLNAPNEWEWAYFLMLLAHLAVFATAAGRYWGLDGLLRPVWRDSTHQSASWLLRVS